MDEAGLRQHWLLGDSKKRLSNSSSPKGRKPIGKFGIGKLATYVLAHRLTHVSKSGGRYWSTSMDYRQIDAGAGNATNEKQVELPLRELTEDQAKEVVFNMIRGIKPTEESLKLFGKGAAQSWTVAVMSELKDMAMELSQGRLRWVLETAMPLSDDFHLFLNGDRILSSKLDAPKIGLWRLGKDVGTVETPIPRPAPDDIEQSIDKKLPNTSEKHFGIFNPVLQRVTGFIEAYEDELKGKSDDWGQSNGFFVYVRGRRINLDDPGFGIDRNKLQHGTFARFRMVVHIDSLDEELRSSRESVREGDRLSIARAILWGGFNWARSRINEHADKSKPGVAMASRVAASPVSLTTRPIYSLLEQALSGNAKPRYIEVPQGLSKTKKAELLSKFEHPDEEGFKLVEHVELAVLTSHDGIARYSVSKRVLTINTMHPFVAHFLNEFQSTARSLPLELFAMSCSSPLISRTRLWPQNHKPCTHEREEEVQQGRESADRT